MKLRRIALPIILCAALACSQITAGGASAFVLNMNAERLSVLQSVLPIPANYTPFVQVWMMDNTANGNAGYQVTLTYTDSSGAQHTATQVVTAPPAWDAQGDTQTLCTFNIDAATVVLATVQPLKIIGALVYAVPI